MEKINNYFPKEIKENQSQSGLKAFVKLFIGASPIKKIVWYLRLSNIFRQHRLRIFSNFMLLKIMKIYNVYIGYNTKILPGLCFPHPTGIVIGEGVSIGKDSTIYQNVTIGGARQGDGKANNYPTIGNNVTIFAGAVIIGNITIGDNCIIGANSVVTKSIPSNCTVAGVPAKIIKEN